MLTPEVYWLVWVILLTALMWIPYIVHRVFELGPPPMAWFAPPDPPPRAAWAGRAMRAHGNAVENLVIFAPLVLIVQVTSNGSTITAIACKVYFFARLAHYIIHVIGAPVILRTLSFLIGVAAQLTLAIHLLR